MLSAALGRTMLAPRLGRIVLGPDEYILSMIALCDVLLGADLTSHILQLFGGSVYGASNCVPQATQIARPSEFVMVK